MSALTGTLSTCQPKQVDVNQRRNDLDNALKTLDSCDPDAANTRKKSEAALLINRFISDTVAKFDNLKSSFDTNVALADQLSASSSVNNYASQLMKQKKGLEHKSRDLEQDERRYRRSFLDGDPQSGVSGPPGVRTADDKVLLTFWVCFGAAVVSVSLIAINYYGVAGSKRWKILSGPVIVAYIIAYFCIVYLA